MILPKNNLSIMDVRNCVGYPSLDLGTLCSLNEKYINKWSKYKPVGNNFTTNRPNDWWKGTMKNCGINFVQHSTIKELIDSVNAGTNQHPYQPPSGGVSSPFRLGDFCKYNSTILPPIVAGNIEGTYSKNNNSFNAGCLINQGMSEDELTVTDIFSNELKNVYYGAALQGTNNSIMWITTASDIKNGTSSVTIPMSGLTANQTYYLYQFLVSFSKPSFTTSEQSGKFVAIPGLQRQAIAIISSNITITLVNLRRNESGVVMGSIRIENQAGTQTFTNVNIQVKYSASKPEDTLLNGERNIKLDNITVQTNQTLVVPFQSPSNTLPEFSLKGGKCLLYMNNKLQTQSQIMQLLPDL